MKPIIMERELTLEGPSARKPQARGRSVSVNLAESPLSWLYARGHLEERQFAAGEKLRRDWEMAGFSPQVTMRWEPRHSRSTGGDGSTTHAAERQLLARERFDGAVMAAGPGLADVLWRVACAGEALPDVEKLLDWPARSGKLVLKLALDRVAGFYRL